MSLIARGQLDNTDNSIEDVLKALNITTSGSFEENKNIASIPTEAPICPFNYDAKDFYTNQTTGPYEMEWFRNYDHYKLYSGSFYSSKPSVATGSPLVSASVDQYFRSPGYNMRPVVLAHHISVDDTGVVMGNVSSSYAFLWRAIHGTGKSLYVTSTNWFGAATAANTVESALVSSEVESYSAANLERRFITSSTAVVAYRNNADSDQTYARVYNVGVSGSISFENAVEISTASTQLFNKGLNVGNNRALFASMRGGNDINLHYFKYNGTNSYTRGTVQVASTQHAGYPTMGYINDDMVAYIYTRRPSTSGQDRYINLKLYDTRTFPPQLITTATEYDTNAQRLGNMGDAAIGRKSNDTRDTFGVYVTSDTGNNKGLAYPFKVSFDPAFSTAEILPSGTAVLTTKYASQDDDVSNSYRLPHHIVPMGVAPDDDTLFLYWCFISPNYSWTIEQDMSTGVLATRNEAEHLPISGATFRRVAFHHFGTSGNGAMGLPSSGFESIEPTMVVCGETKFSNSPDSLINLTGQRFYS